MPELPDVTVYMEALETRILGRTLERALIAGPSLLRTADPPVQAAESRRVSALRRIGKRIAIGVEGELWLVLHLMIAGRLHWSSLPKRPDGRRTLAAFLFDSGCLPLPEAGTLKRALTDPRLFSGIGNAYSDEILHRARLSPVALTSRLSGEEIRRLHEAV